ncbi:helix-turn-helix domain-containing protein [Rhizobium sp. BR 317]|uniref:helix-turn-helix domain-containing protein n=1 Tax=Rhizobium sp. BR 317 TaxID=3040015 RepID=UPI0039BF49B8
MDHVSKNFGASNALREARLENGYSLEELAITTGLTTAEIAAFERGDEVPGNHVERIKHALKKPRCRQRHRSWRQALFADAAAILVHERPTSATVA